jgi:hypothetical protein
MKKPKQNKKKSSKNPSILKRISQSIVYFFLGCILLSSIWFMIIQPAIVIFNSKEIYCWAENKNKSKRWTYTCRDSTRIITGNTNSLSLEENNRTVRILVSRHFPQFYIIPKSHKLLWLYIGSTFGSGLITLVIVRFKKNNRNRM